MLGIAKKNASLSPEKPGTFEKQGTQAQSEEFFFPPTGLPREITSTPDRPSGT